MRTVRLDETIDAIALYYAQGWTDGLSVVLVTLAALAPEAVRQRAAAVMGRMITQLVTAH